MCHRFSPLPTFGQDGPFFLLIYSYSSYKAQVSCHFLPDTFHDPCSIFLAFSLLHQRLDEPGTLHLPLTTCAPVRATLRDVQESRQADVGP